MVPAGVTGAGCQRFLKIDGWHSNDKKTDESLHDEVALLVRGGKGVAGGCVEKRLWYGNATDACCRWKWVLFHVSTKT